MSRVVAETVFEGGGRSGGGQVGVVTDNYPSGQAQVESFRGAGHLVGQLRVLPGQDACG